MIEVGSMDILETIRCRRSIRAFSGRPVDNKMLDLVLEAAQWAPSAGNIQPWEVVIVRKRETKAEIAKAAFEQTFLEEASVILIMCADEKRSGMRYGKRGEALYCIKIQLQLFRT